MKPTTHGSITGVVFEDANNNSLQDAGEMALSSIVVARKVLPFALVKSTTNASGQFGFTDVPEGNAQIEVTVPAGYTATTPGVLVVPVKAGQTSTGWAFGLRQVLGSVSVNIFDDLDSNDVQDPATEMGLAGVGVEPTDAKGVKYPAVADGKGNYSFTKIPEGMASLTLKKSGYVDVTVAVNVEGGKMGNVTVGMKNN